jgi:hypothetical protein
VLEILLRKKVREKWDPQPLWIENRVPFGTHTLPFIGEKNRTGSSHSEEFILLTPPGFSQLWGT